jgi:hypothetical protein
MEEKRKTKKKKDKKKKMQPARHTEVAWPGLGYIPFP